MKRPHYMTILIFAIVLFSASCHKDTIKPNTRATEYFPNKVGDYWEYEVYDSSEARGTYSSYPRSYSVTVKVIGTKSLVDGKDVSMWKYQYPWGSDTNYVRIVDDTVKFYDKFRIETLKGLNYPLQIFLIPFHERLRWDGKLVGIDTSYVTLQPSIITSFGWFENGFKVYHHYVGPNIDNNDDYFFASNIGFVKLHYRRYNLAPLNIELWQLKRYYLD